MVCGRFSCAGNIQILSLTLAILLKTAICWNTSTVNGRTSTNSLGMVKTLVNSWPVPYQLVDHLCFSPSYWVCWILHDGHVYHRLARKPQGFPGEMKRLVFITNDPVFEDIWSRNLRKASNLRGNHNFGASMRMHCHRWYHFSLRWNCSKRYQYIVLNHPIWSLLWHQLS